MKKENILVIVLVCLFMGGVYLYKESRQNGFSNLFSSNSVQENEESSLIDWKPFDQGLKLASEQNKPVFLYFYADWCSFCKKLKKTTFKDKEVLAYLNANFISIRIDTDRDRQRAMDWQVKGLPTLWFLDSAAKKINAIPGYVDENRFLSVLKYQYTQSYKTMTFRQFTEQNN